MDPSRLNSLELLLEVIREHTPKSIWTGAPLAPFRAVANTNRGDIGEEFLRRYLGQHGIVVFKAGSRIDAADMQIKDKFFEVKTASEDTGGSFQFNHIRLDREYDYLLCLGIRPAAILFNVWTKGAVAEGKAGKLVRMAEGQSVTHKLTKRPASMRPIKDLPKWVQQHLGGAPVKI